MASARFFARLPFFLHRKIGLAEARLGVEERQHRRSARLLDRLLHDVCERPGSVYHQLFRHAGLEPGDAEKLLKQEGVDGALHTLFRAGIYLTVDEFKGRTPVIRGNLQIEVAPELLRSPRAAFHLRGTSGGSRSSGTPVLMDLGFVRDCAANCLVLMDAWGISNAVKADYESPGSGARFRLVKLAAFGELPRAWFTQIAPSDSLHLAETRLNTLAMRLSSAAAGRPLPGPIYSPLSDPSPAAEWMASILREGGLPMTFTFPGTAVRVCSVAQDRGIDIAGAYFLIAGEPVTAARVATIRQSGAVPIPRYGSMEVGAIGYGCPRGTYPDDVHLTSDMNALIAPLLAYDGSTLPELPRSAVFVTSLHARSPFLMLNVSMGDQAEIERSSCGCALEHLGWTTRLHSIRSFEKLTAGGVTFHGSDVIRILEEVLPARFGGRPTDYQLREGESPNGDPLLELLMDPGLGLQEEDMVKAVFLDELAKGPAPAPRMVQSWREAGTVQVVRKPPVSSGAGKILHLTRQKPA